MDTTFRSGELVEHLPSGRTYYVRYYNSVSRNVRALQVAIRHDGSWVWVDNTRTVTLAARNLQLWSAKS